MKEDFNKTQAKKYLKKKQGDRRETKEKKRQELLKKVVNIIKREFSDNGLEVYLVGSITQPFQFHENSDIDIVIKNFYGDRFELWNRLEDLLGQKVEVILFESCHFKDHVSQKGMRIV